MDILYIMDSLFIMKLSLNLMMKLLSLT